MLAKATEQARERGGARSNTRCTLRAYSRTNSRMRDLVSSLSGFGTPRVAAVPSIVGGQEALGI